MICTLVEATPPLESICGLSDPFKSTGKQYLSPIVGVEEHQIRELRFHGNYSSQKSDFPPVKHNQLKEDDLPQDPVSAVLQRLFPCPLHDVLTPNNLQQDPLRKWLKPAAIAKIFNHIDDHQKFDAMAENERLIGFLAALTPEEYIRLEKKAKFQATVEKKNVLEILLSKFKRHDALDFAKLLNQAVKKSRSPDPEDTHIYPPYVIESVLLTYMWRQAPNKPSLKEYYDALSDELMDKKTSIDFQLFYTKEDYFSLKEVVNSGKLSIQEFMKDPEKMALLAFGHAYYEDPLPPVFPYGPVKYVDPDEKSFAYTNCGEMLLMTLFDTVNFDSKQRIFRLPLLEELKEKGLSPLKEFITFYSEINTYPSQSNTQPSLNAWSQLVSNLNKPNDPDPIHYLKDKGKKVKKGTNGIYELGNGLHNVLRVVGKLIGDPQWQPMNQTGEDLIKVIQGNLDRFCSLFTRENFISEWYEKGTTTKEIKDPNTVNIVFKNSEKDQFELHISPGHFKFKKSYESGFYDIGEKMVSHLHEWHPLYRHFIKVKYIKEILEHIPSEKLDSFFSEYLYSMDLDSMKGKTKAMKAIVAYKERFKKATFDKLPNKWLTDEGEYFSNWSDPHTNSKVLNALASFKILEGIKSLGIKKFNEMLSTIQTQKTISVAATYFHKDLIKLILEQPGALELFWDKSFEDCGFDEEEEDPLEGQSLNLRVSLLHIVADNGLSEFIQPILDLGADVNEKDFQGSTPLIGATKLLPFTHKPYGASTKVLYKPYLDVVTTLIRRGADTNAIDNYTMQTSLHYAAQHNWVDAIVKLIEAGADKEAQDNHGNRPLHIAACFGSIEAAQKLKELGAKE